MFKNLRAWCIRSWRSLQPKFVSGLFIHLKIWISNIEIIKQSDAELNRVKARLQEIVRDYGKYRFTLRFVSKQLGYTRSRRKATEVYQVLSAYGLISSDKKSPGMVYINV